MSWLTNWNRRKQITVNGSSAGAQSDYQMKLTVNQASGADSSGVVNLGGNVQTTFNDLRFTKSDGTTTLNYWIESITGTTPNQTVTVWIKLAPSPDTIPASPGTYNFYIYYENPGATSASNGTNVFELYEDGTLSAQWNQIQPSGISTSGGVITLYKAAYPNTALISSNYQISDGIIELRAKEYNPSYHGMALCLRRVSSTSINNDPRNDNGQYGITNSYSGFEHSFWINQAVKANMAIAPSNNTWYYYRAILTGTNLTFNSYTDGAFGSPLATVNYNDSGGITRGYVGITPWNTGDTITLDWYRIRKYASPEPTFSTAGTEEFLTTPAALGGTVTTTATQRIHTFTSSGIFTSYKSMNIEILVVAGGGAGGGGGGGGGGAGGLLHSSSYGIIPYAYTVTIGGGGIGASDTKGTNGGSTMFDTLTALGGGAGGSMHNGGTNNIDRHGENGGSGGGDGGTNIRNLFGLGTSGQGNNGGSSSDWVSGGGGGAGAVGQDGTASTKSGNGGVGLSYSISGILTYYAGGGGGSPYTGSYTGGTGGLGGGGNGTGINQNAITNTGGGGGASPYGTAIGGNGGSGIVIIRYLLSEDLTAANITATSMSVVPRENPCRTGICIIDVTVTWTNNGELTGSFIPSITASSGTVSTQSSRNLDAGLSVTLPFTVSGMTVGTCSICPNPN